FAPDPPRPACPGVSELGTDRLRFGIDGRFRRPDLQRAATPLRSTPSGGVWSLDILNESILRAGCAEASNLLCGGSSNHRLVGWRSLCGGKGHWILGQLLAQESNQVQTGGSRGRS